MLYKIIIKFNDELLYKTLHDSSPVSHFKQCKKHFLKYWCSAIWHDLQVYGHAAPNHYYSGLLSHFSSIQYGYLHMKSQYIYY